MISRCGLVPVRRSKPELLTALKCCVKKQVSAINRVFYCIFSFYILRLWGDDEILVTASIVRYAGVQVIALEWPSKLHFLCFLGHISFQKHQTSNNRFQSIIPIGQNIFLHITKLTSIKNNSTRLYSLAPTLIKNLNFKPDLAT